MLILRRLSFVCAALSLVVNVAQAQIPQSVRDQAIAATVLIYQGRVAGSGVLIQLPGRPVEVLSAWHCVKDDQPVFVWTTTSPAWHPAEIIARDKEHDLALLRIEHPAPPKPLSIARTSVDSGDPVVTSGWADDWQGKGPSLMDMKALGASGHWRLVSEKPRPGRSGGPAVNAAGELIGICYGYSLSTGLYCDLPHIRDFLGYRTTTVQLPERESWRGHLSSVYIIVIIQEE